MDLKIKMVKLEIYAPEEYVVQLRDCLTEVGACKVGAYDHVVSYHDAKGFWRPLEGSSPFRGECGEICAGCEVKLEALCPVELMSAAAETVKRIHPYEEPVINIIPLLSL